MWKFNLFMNFIREILQTWVRIILSWATFYVYRKQNQAIINPKQAKL